MASDAHAHPDDLLRVFSGAETERRSLKIVCAASATLPDEFLRNEALSTRAREDGAPPLYLCFAVHPQLPAYSHSFDTTENAAPQRGVVHIGAARSYPKDTANFTAFHKDMAEYLTLLETLAAEHRIAAVGETGFDLYSEAFKQTEALQDELFAAHLDIALRYAIPLVVHVRCAIHKLFPYAKKLSGLPAVAFHSWPGAPEEARAFLRKGIRAFFSFGATLLCNHKNAIRTCAALPAEHLLFETDAPYQPARGDAFSRWSGLSGIIRAAARIRNEAGAGNGREMNAEELERVTDGNFLDVFAR